MAVQRLPEHRPQFRPVGAGDHPEIRDRGDIAICRRCERPVMLALLGEHLDASCGELDEVGVEGLPDWYDCDERFQFSPPFRNRIPDASAAAGYRLSDPYLVVGGHERRAEKRPMPLKVLHGDRRVEKALRQMHANGRTPRRKAE